MNATEQEKLVRAYAAGEIAWTTLRARGLDSYAELLASLGALGLHPPIAPMDGPNRKARERGRAILRAALRAAP